MGRRSLPRGVRIRPIAPSDRGRLEAFYSALSSDSLNARFHGATRGITGMAARIFCDPDHEHREGFVASIRRQSGEELIGHLCLEPTQHGSAEMAIAVADAWQRRGIGHALLRAGIDWGRRHGFDRMTADIRWSNPAIMGLLRSVSCPTTIAATDDGGIRATLRILEDLPVAA